MKKHIIFDFDDTISSSYDLNQQLFYETFLPYSKNLDEDYIRNYHKATRGVSMHDLFEHVAKKYNINKPIEELVRENKNLHKKHSGDMTIFDGVEELLRFFKSSGRVISICTNRDKGSLDLILNKYNLHEYFDNIISCADEGRQKPDPYCLINLNKKYPAINLDQVVYFGDSKTDADFAANAGVEYVLVDHYLNNKKFYALILNMFPILEDELLVETDKEDNDIASIYKMEAHNTQTRYHRAAHIVLFNTKGNVILQKRSIYKKFDPEMWDISGGHQTFGMSIEETAHNELLEEIGIDSKVTFVRKGFKNDGKQLEIIYLYYATHDGPYRADPNEVEEIKEFEPEKLLRGEYEECIKLLPHVLDYIRELKDVKPWA